MGRLNKYQGINDDGSRLKGTPVNNAMLQSLQTVVEDEVLSGNFPNITTRALMDNVAGANIPFDFGGVADMGAADNPYPVGATAYTAGGVAILAPSTRVLRIDSAWILEGSYALEAMLRTVALADPGSLAAPPAGAATLGLFNLTDAPEVPIVEITASTYTGALVRSALLTSANFPAAGVSKDYGVKLKANSAGGTWLAFAWGIRFLRVL